MRAAKIQINYLHIWLICNKKKHFLPTPGHSPHGSGRNTDSCWYVDVEHTGGINKKFFTQVHCKSKIVILANYSYVKMLFQASALE